MIALLTGVVCLLVIQLFIASRFVRCPANKVLVIQGNVGPGKVMKCIHGGMAIVWPLIQEHHFLDLTPLTITVSIKGALSKDEHQVDVAATFIVAIDNKPEIISVAAVRLLRLGLCEIQMLAEQIISGQFRLAIGSLTIQEMVRNRERFLDVSRNSVQPELQKIGLALINLNVTEITDERSK